MGILDVQMTLVYYAHTFRNAVHDTDLCQLCIKCLIAFNAAESQLLYFNYIGTSHNELSNLKM